MNSIHEAESVKKDELVYWIDRKFVQHAALARIGRNLNNDEIQRFTQIVGWGLWDSVRDTVNVAIDETVD